MEPPKIWRERAERYLGIGIECLDCNKKYFPKKIICPSCGSARIKDYRISERGRLKYFTQVSVTGQEMEFNTPYIVGIVELDDELKVTAQIVDVEYNDLEEDMKVRMIFRVLAKDGAEGLIRYGFKFTPA